MLIEGQAIAFSAHRSAGANIAREANIERMKGRKNVWAYKHTNTPKRHVADAHMHVVMASTNRLRSSQHIFWKITYVHTNLMIQINLFIIFI